jgi:hypothetical protein
LRGRLSQELDVRHKIDSRQRKLDSYFSRASDKNVGEEVQADLARFGAVLICGYVEQCVADVILARLSPRAQPRVLNFVKSHLRRGTNYDCGAIAELLERFETGWAKDLREFCEENARHVEAINSAYALRNSIAHGGDANRGMKGVLELYESALAVVDALEKTTAL